MANIVFNIPFPYKEFTDTTFIVSDKNGLFIPDNCYTKSATQIKFSTSNTIGVTNTSEIKFTFFHAKNKRWIGKKEYHFTITEAGQTVISLDQSPYNQLVNLKKRIYVFYNRQRLSNGIHYHINNFTGQITLTNKRMTSLVGDTVDVLILYDYDHNNGAIIDLPQSGYISLSKTEIDRNYNTKLMALFINGSLVEPTTILQMSNTLFKIRNDIKTRYNIEVKNLSPRIHSMIPYYKQHCIFQEEKNEFNKNISCHIEVKEVLKGRRILPLQISPIFFNPDLTNAMPYNELKNTFENKLPELDWDNTSISYIKTTLKENGLGVTSIDNNELWINLILKKSDINYELKMFENDVIENPSAAKVIMQLRKRTYRDFIPNNKSSSIVSVLPTVITNPSKDELLLSIQYKTIIEMSSEPVYYTYDDIYEFMEYLTKKNLIKKIPVQNRIDIDFDDIKIIQKKMKKIKKQLNLEYYDDGDIDGVIGKFQINIERSIKEYPIYFTLTTSSTTKKDIPIFVWSISTEKHNKGLVLWNKQISLSPDK